MSALANLTPYFGGGVVGVIIAAIIVGIVNMRMKRTDIVESARQDLADTAREMIDGLRAEISGVRDQWRADLAQRDADIARVNDEATADRARRRAAEHESDEMRAFVAVVMRWAENGAHPPPPTRQSNVGGSSGPANS